MAGRPRTEIDRELFTNTIIDAETEQTFDSQLALHKFIGEILEIPHYTVANRIKEWGIVTKTQPGRRGRPAGSGKAASLVRPTVKSKVQPSDVDLSDLFAAFAPLGIKTSADLLTSVNKTPEQNEAIRDCWKTLRSMVDMEKGS